jgi:hypothetical protein
MKIFYIPHKWILQNVIDKRDKLLKGNASIGGEAEKG